MPVVPSYGGDEEYTLQGWMQSYQPRQTWMPGMRPIFPQQAAPSLFGGNVFGGSAPVMRKVGSGYNSMLARQQWSSLATGFQL